MFEQMKAPDNESILRIAWTYMMYACHNKVMFRAENPFNNAAMRAYTSETAI